MLTADSTASSSGVRAVTTSHLRSFAMNSPTSDHGALRRAGGTHSCRPSNSSSTKRTSRRLGVLTPNRMTTTCTSGSWRRARYAHASPGACSVMSQPQA
jgi:hypothetical protein